MKVLNKFIIIEKSSTPNERASGLLMTSDDTKELRYHKAEALNVGSMVSGIVNGDTIFFDKSAGYDVLIDDKRLTVIQEKDVVCVL
jgi:co-chaperonin GroES (HSP10)